jgi:dipeptidyl aminopeptidase/acylaminoacyl peptidase
LETIPGSDFGDGYNSSLSPDASRLATSSRVEGTADVWLLDVKRGVSTRFTTDPAFDLMPVWSPDGLGSPSPRIEEGLRVRRCIGGPPMALGNDELLVAKELGPYDWSPDGRFILYVIAG